jgi:hypothetical protein
MNICADDGTVPSCTEDEKSVTRPRGQMLAWRGQRCLPACLKRSFKSCQPTV